MDKANTFTNRELKIEGFIISELIKSQSALDVTVLKESLYKKASMNTLKSIVEKSDNLVLSGGQVNLDGVAYDITYQFTGSNLTAAQIGGQNVTLLTGTAFGVLLKGPNYSFGLRVQQSGNGQWQFNTSSITPVFVGAGPNRKLAAPMVSSQQIFIGTVPTI